MWVEAGGNLRCELAFRSSECDGSLCGLCRCPRSGLSLVVWMPFTSGRQGVCDVCQGSRLGRLVLALDWADLWRGVEGRQVSRRRVGLITFEEACWLIVTIAVLIWLFAPIK